MDFSPEKRGISNWIRNDNRVVIDGWVMIEQGIFQCNGDIILSHDTLVDVWNALYYGVRFNSMTDVGRIHAETHRASGLVVLSLKGGQYCT